MLIDTHAHLTDERYHNPQEIISSFNEDYLKAVITVGFDLNSSVKGLKLAKENERVYCAVGVHPSEAQDAVNEYGLNELLKISSDKKCVAIGEIGLDYHYPDTDKSMQKKALMNQLELVKKSDLPVIFHLRDAFSDMLDIVKANLDLMPKRGVMHCFSGSKETARQYLDMGFYISFAGPVTFKNAKSMPEIVSFVPRDRLLVETDCPYLTPHPHRGKLNFPKYVKLTAEKIAEFLGTDLETVASLTTQNALRLFDRLKL